MFLYSFFVVYLAFARYRNQDKYAASSEIESLAVSLKERKLATVILTAIIFGGWLYETFRYALGDFHELYTLLDLIVYCVVWVSTYLFFFFFKRYGSN